MKRAKTAILLCSTDFSYYNIGASKKQQLGRSIIRLILAWGAFFKHLVLLTPGTNWLTKTWANLKHPPCET